MVIRRLYGPGLPIMAWFHMMGHQFTNVSVVKEVDLQELEKEVAVLKERLRVCDEARKFWHASYTGVAATLPDVNPPSASSPGSSPRSEPPDCSSS